MGATELINAVTSCLSLLDRYQPHGASHLDVDDDFIISHTCSCCLGVNDHEGNKYITPERSPPDHVELDYAAPYETSEQAWDRLLNHNDMLVEENQKLQC